MYRDISFCFSKCSQLVIGRYCTIQLTADGFCIAISDYIELCFLTKLVPNTSFRCCFHFVLVRYATYFVTFCYLQGLLFLYKHSLVFKQTIGLLVMLLQSPNLGFPAVTDRKCGVNLWAISMFCTGLLTVFLNSEVIGLAGLISYILLWKSFGTVPG